MNRFLNDKVYLDRILKDIKRQLAKNKPLDRIMNDVGYSHYLYTEEMDYIRNEVKKHEW